MTQQTLKSKNQALKKNFCRNPQISLLNSTEKLRPETKKETC